MYDFDIIQMHSCTIYKDSILACGTFSRGMLSKKCWSFNKEDGVTEAAEMDANHFSGVYTISQINFAEFFVGLYSYSPKCFFEKFISGRNAQKTNKKFIGFFKLSPEVDLRSTSKFQKILANTSTTQQKNIIFFIFVNVYTPFQGRW